MLRSDKTIISCAITGSIHTPSMSPSLPVTPDAIAEQAIAAVEAGAAIIHLHARDPETGRPSPDPELFRVPVEALRARTDAILNISTGGSAEMTIEERLAPAIHWAPELASLNMGSMNFVFAAAARRVERWLHPWEEPYVLGSADRIFANTFSQIERTVGELGALGTRFEFECYDVGHLYTLAHFADRELVQPPFWIQTIYGVLGGIGADQENLTHMVRIADRLFGDDYVLSTFAAGRHQMDFVTASALHGGHVRVGLEDNLMIARGTPATDNAQQVTKAATILRELGRTIATPAQARDALRLGGRG
jgi:3,5-dioxohexanoate:acetyl-CoA acetone transferase